MGAGGGPKTKNKNKVAATAVAGVASTGVEFTGFAAFATPDALESSTTAAASLAAARAAASASAKQQKKKGDVATGAGGSGVGGGAGGSIQPPSPLYAGSNATLSTLFRRIGQKRDAVTKCRALIELRSYAFPSSEEDTTTDDGGEGGADGGVGTSEASTPRASATSPLPRPDKVAALSHLVYLHTTKLHYDNVPSVRAESYRTLTAAHSHVPKAWIALVMRHNNGEAAGMAWCTAKEDPSADVRDAASATVHAMTSAEQPPPKTAAAEETEGLLRTGTCSFVRTVLSYSRAQALHEALGLNRRVAASSAGRGGSGGGSKKKGGGGKGQQRQEGKGEMTDAERDEMEERYERTMLCAIRGLARLVESYPEAKFEEEEEDVAKKRGEADGEEYQKLTVRYADMFAEDVNLPFKGMGNSRGSFRRATYDLVSSLCQHGPSLVHPTATTTAPSTSHPPASTSSTDDDDTPASKREAAPPKSRLPTLLPQAVSSERDPSNFSSLFEAILLYVASFRRRRKRRPPAQPSSNEGDDAAKDSDDENVTVANDDGAAWDVPNGGMDAPGLVKSLCKALRKACLGGPAVQWGPAVLPLVASLPRSEGKLQNAVVKSLWEGRTSAVGSADEAAIVSAVVECSSFLLLRRRTTAPRPLIDDDGRSGNDNDDDEATLAKECAKYFLHALSYYLDEATSPSAVRVISPCLARDLCKLDEASDEGCNGGDDRWISSVRPWFWGEEGIGAPFRENLDSAASKKTSILIRDMMRCEMHRQSKGEGASMRAKRQSNLGPTFCGLFHALVAKSRSGMDTIPSEDESDLAVAILSFSGVNYVFLEGGAYSDREGQLPLQTNAADKVEAFCINDLLRWIIMRKPSSAAAIKTNFSLLRICLQTLPTVNSQKELWESMLRELIKAEIDLMSLALGLSVLANRDEASAAHVVDIVKCETLDDFATRVGEEASETFRHNAEAHRGGVTGDSETDDESTSAAAFARKGAPQFLQTCCGLAPKGSSILVSANVLLKWIETVCNVNKPPDATISDHLFIEDEEGLNALLEALLMLASSDNIAALKDGHRIQLALESWRQGGRFWRDSTIELLVGDCSPLGASAKGEFLSSASAALKKELRVQGSNDHAVLELSCQSWSDRAWRLIQLLRRSRSTYAAPMLSYVGLDNISLWESVPHDYWQSERLYLYLMYLLHNIESSSGRRELLLGQEQPEGKSAKLFVHILNSIVIASVEPPNSLDRRLLRNVKLLEVLGGKEGFTKEFIEACCSYSIRVLSTHLVNLPSQSSAYAVDTRCAVTALDSLVGFLFGKFQPHPETETKTSTADDINPTDVKEGDVLWYTNDGKAPNSGREKVTVVRVHADDYPNLYFTVRLENDDCTVKTERQTVASRLKLQQFAVDRADQDQSMKMSHFMSDEDKARRQRIEGQIYDQLVKPYLTTFPLDDNHLCQLESAAECVNIIVSRCGLTGKGGLGSIRYDVFQKVSSLERDVCGSFAAPDRQAGISTPLRCLSLAMGLGYVTAPSSSNFDTLRFEPLASIGAILDHYENQDWQSSHQKDETPKGLHSSVLMWLSAAVSTLTDAEALRRIMAVLSTISGILLAEPANVSEADVESTLKSSLLVMEAFHETQKASLNCIDYCSDDSDAEKQILEKMVKCFVSVWENGSVVEGSLEEQKDHPVWLEPFVSLIMHNVQQGRGNLLPAVRDRAEDLCDSLFSEDKCWCGFQLLHLLAKDASQLRPDDSVSIPVETRQRVEFWSQKLEDEEAEELEEDVEVTASWLPHKLMNKLETWGEITEVELATGGQQTRGILLAWLLCLDFLDSAAGVDMRNRTSISSYIEKTHALSNILAIALQHAALDNQGNDSWFTCTALDDDRSKADGLNLSRVATLAVFRTVETLPTLIKTWFNDYCPRSLQSLVSQFVQNQVAPESLRRELARIKDAADLGDMSVSGSCVSREVVATYAQDECQLSVMIRIPPSFPLRNVEVDCQKTLGIAEKRWRRWALQIMRMLNSEDGSVLDALLLWKQNVDKEFEGVEPCPVCYSVLCVKTHALPNLECKTCQNRFHTSCLYKWFHSSGKSQCVLCQQPWSGTKI